MSEDQFKNSLCRIGFHDFRSTASPMYRVCQRKNCKAAEHLQHGKWVAVPTRSARKQRTVTLPPVLLEQADLTSVNNSSN